MARAAVAAGADGIIVEVHHDPNHALIRWCAITLSDQFSVMKEVRMIARAIERSIA